jgi:hypothetical protein
MLQTPALRSGFQIAAGMRDFSDAARVRALTQIKLSLIR